MAAKRIHVMTKNDLFETLLSVSFFAALYFLLYQVQVKVLSDYDFLPMARILFIPAGIKFLAMVVGQAPGVVGIALGFAWVEINAVKTLDITAFLTHVLLWLVLPYVLLRGYLAKAGLKRLDYANHLPAVCDGSHCLSHQFAGHPALLFWAPRSTVPRFKGGLVDDDR